MIGNFQYYVCETDCGVKCRAEQYLFGVEDKGATKGFDHYEAKKCGKLGQKKEMCRMRHVGKNTCDPTEPYDWQSLYNFWQKEVYEAANKPLQAMAHIEREDIMQSSSSLSYLHAPEMEFSAVYIAALFLTLIIFLCGFCCICGLISGYLFGWKVKAATMDKMRMNNVSIALPNV